MHPIHDYHRQLTRRALLTNTCRGLGGMALGSMLMPQARASAASDQGDFLLQMAPRAKRVIYLFQSGGPSHIDLFDYKPGMRELHGQELPDSMRGTQRVTGMTSGQKEYPFTAPLWELKRCGAHGTWISDLFPHTQTIADDITIVRTMNTEAINHDPAVTFIITGSQQMGHASMGSWLSYGLGTENEDLPSFMVLLSQGTGKNPGQPLYSRLWGNGYLPSSYQGVNLRSGADPVLYLQNPPGVDRTQRRQALDYLAQLNHARAKQVADPEIHARIDAYEMAYRMQISVPALMDLGDESEATFERYGADARRPGSYAANCLLARRLAERGVRFIQLFHRGWDQHKRGMVPPPVLCRTARA